MKPIIPFALLGALLAVGAADAAVTDPVGYITVSIVGAGETYISPTLVEPDVFSAASSVTPSGGSVITFTPTSGVPAGLDNSYVLEIKSSGWWATVVSSDAALGTITVNSPFPASLPASTQVAVRKHSTLATFMGNNAPGLTTFNGVDPSDEVQILDASAVPQSVTTFGYVSGPDLADPLYPNGAWFNLAASAVDNNFVIEPGTAIRIKRVGATTLSFVVDGEVKTTPTQVDLFSNFNWVGTGIAALGTLNSNAFNSQLIQFDGVNPNYDELQILRPNQNGSPFAAILDGVTPTSTTMFDLANSVDAGTEPFKEGTGVIINRIGNPASVITLPGSTVAP
jgi:hypothetical protein